MQRLSWNNAKLGNVRYSPNNIINVPKNSHKEQKRQNSIISQQNPQNINMCSSNTMHPRNQNVCISLPTLQETSIGSYHMIHKIGASEQCKLEQPIVKILK